MSPVERSEHYKKLLLFRLKSLRDSLNAAIAYIESDAPMHAVKPWEEMPGKRFEIVVGNYGITRIDKDNETRGSVWDFGTPPTTPR